MACRGGCITVTVSYQHLDVVVLVTPPTPVACVVSTPYTADVYGNALDFNAILCVTGDSSFYYSQPLGDIVLGDAILG